MGSLSTEATVCCSTVGRRTRYNGPSAGELVRAEKVPQTLANHAGFDPRFHFFALPAFLISWMEASCWQGDIPAFLAAWEVVLMTAATGSGLQDSLVWACGCKTESFGWKNGCTLAAFLRRWSAAELRNN